MFYVSVSTEVLKKVLDHAQSSAFEQGGFLIGRLVGQALMIDAAVTGETHSNSTEVTLPAETIAKIADDIMKGRIKGNVVGWYHSHPTGGVFLSDTDVATQLNLQQFSPLVVALVIDPNTGEMGFFTVDGATGVVVPIPLDRVLAHSPDGVHTPRQRPFHSLNHESRRGRIPLIPVLAAALIFQLTHWL